MKHLKTLLNDTLKKDGKWSRTSLTMLTAWIMAIFMALYDLFKHGFSFEVFLTFVAVATGVKIADAYSTKLKNDANTAGTGGQN